MPRETEPPPNVQMQVVHAMVQAWPSARKIREIAGQSEEPIESVLVWSVTYAFFLLDLFAFAQGKTRQELYDVLADMFAAGPGED
ncbi:MAG: hypothetical protein WB565_18675 [Acidimicrobiales bacterium]